MLPHSFVWTDEKATEHYCAAIELPHFSSLAASAVQTAPESGSVFVCFQSRWPVFQILHGLLSGLVQLSSRAEQLGSRASLLGGWVRMLVEHVPSPLGLWGREPGALTEARNACFEHCLAFDSLRGLLPRVQWAAELDVAMRLPSFEQPRTPATAKDLLVFFRLLGRECATKLVLTALLEQAVIVLHCDIPGLLVPVAETLRSLLLPFHWSFNYVPLLPRSVDAEQTRNLLDSPMPIIVGMTTTHFCETVRQNPLGEGDKIVVVDLLWRMRGGRVPPVFPSCLSKQGFMSSACSGRHLDDGVARVDVGEAWSTLQAEVDACTVRSGWDEVGMAQLLAISEGWEQLAGASKELDEHTAGRVDGFAALHRLESDARAIKDAFVTFFVSVFCNYSLDTYWQDWSSGETVEWRSSFSIEAETGDGAFRVRGIPEKKLKFVAINGAPVDPSTPTSQVTAALPTSCPPCASCGHMLTLRP